MTEVLGKTHVIVATYGDNDWAERGDHVAQRTEDVHGHAIAEVIRTHATTLQEARNGAAMLVPVMRWLCFLDADDELEPGYFEAMHEARMTPGAGSPVLLVPAVRYVHADGHADWPTIPNAEPRRPLHEINIAVIGTLITSNLFAALGGFRDWPAYEDWDLWLRAQQQYSAELVEVPDAVYRANMNPRGRNLLDRRSLDTTYHAIRKDLGYE